MPPEVKQAIAELQAAHKQFVDANDARLKEIEKKGSSDAVTAEKVEKINNTVSDLVAKVEAAVAAAKNAENIASRAPVGAEGAEATAKERAFVAQFFAQRAGKSAEEFEVTDSHVEQFRAYKGAFNRYCRVGDQAMTAEIRAAMTVGSDPNGGYWVPPDTTGRIVEFVRETSPIRQLASVVSIGTDSIKGPKDLDDIDYGWVGETSSRPVTANGQVGEWQIFVREMYASPKASQQLLDDSQVDVEGWLTRKVGSRFARAENNKFFTGDGTSAPRGLLTYAAGTPNGSTTWGVIQQYLSGQDGGFASQKPGDKLIDLAFGLKAAYRGNANWLMNRKTVSEVRKLKDGQGNYLWTLNFEQRQGQMLLGYPIAECEDMPDISSGSLSIAFGDIREAYQIVDRQGIRVLRDPFTAKPWVIFYSTRRVGGDVVNFDAVKLMKMSAS